MLGLSALSSSNKSNTGEVPIFPALIIPLSVKKIDGAAFRGCKQLEEVELCEGIEEIGSYAFSGSGIKAVKIPSSIKWLAESAFSECKQLEEVELCEGIEMIGAYAFSGSGIKTMKIPASIKRIDSGAFFDCSRLEVIELAEGVDMSVFRYEVKSDVKFVKQRK